MAGVVLAAAVLVTAMLIPASSQAASKKVQLTGGDTRLTLDAGTAAALTSIGISVEPVTPAKPKGGAVSFPISGGKVNAKTLAGNIKHRGGLAFVKGSTRVELTKFTINIDAAPDLTALLGPDRVSILKLDLSKLKRTDKGSTVRLSGIRADLTAGAADALNKAFSTNAFKEDLTLGTAKVKAKIG
jgi:hypothetical protein